MSVGSGQKPPVIFLMGPTATGKTDVAAALCDHLPVELISVDSTLVYRGLDIGTAKPDAALLARAPHHLIDIRDPADPYSAADFARDVLPLLESITMAGRIPLLVGGTMLYFRVLLEGLGDLPPSDPAVREEILAQAEQLGWPALHKELMAVDPETANALHPNHSQRIQRALEIYRLTGLPPSRIKRQAEGGIQPITDKYEVIQLALTPQHRQLLHRRIAERFQRMLEQGFIDEVKALRARPDLNSDLPAIRAVGYRQVWDHLAGNDDYQTMVNKSVAATRQLAKRQLTWLRRWPSLAEVAIDTEQGEAKSLEEIVSNCLKFLQNGPIY